MARAARPSHTGSSDLSGVFAAGRSLMHRRDPRAKLALAAGFSLLVALCTRPFTLWLALGMAVLVLILSRPPLRPLWLRLASLNIFTLLLWLTLPLQIEWQPGWHLSWGGAGLGLAYSISLKTNAILLAFIALVATSSANQVIHALDHFGLPPKLIHLFAFFYRYIFVLRKEQQRQTWALKARGFRVRADWHTYRTLAYQVGMLLVRSYDRAQRVYQAMLCRGFSGHLWLLDHFAWQHRDTAFCLAGGLGLAILLGMEVMVWS